MPRDATARSSPLVLIVDDDPAICVLLARFVKRIGFEPRTCATSRAALEALPSMRPDVALIDLQMPDVDGLEILKAVRERARDCRAVLMTGQPSVETAIMAIKLGALDYLSKPFELSRLRDVLSMVGQRLDRQRDMFAAESNMAACAAFCGMVGRSAEMQGLFDTIGRLAPHVRTALINGETGTGKELVARALHTLGPRKDRRFVPFNCAAVVETLFESEFFGHARRAFTGAGEARTGLFELADGGTLFLDEIGEMPLAIQAKLLRVVESQEVHPVGSTVARRVDVQVLAATNRKLSDDVKAGRFREDLYYRLNVVEIVLPPLRERREDIRLLVATFVADLARRFQKPIVGLTTEAERLLLDASWPGNVRQLKNVLERACMLSLGTMLGEDDILASMGPAREPDDTKRADLTTTAPPLVEPVPVRVTREDLERALASESGNRSAAARRLGMSRRALYRRLAAFNLR